VIVADEVQIGISSVRPILLPSFEAASYIGNNVNSGHLKLGDTVALTSVKHHLAKFLKIKMQLQFDPVILLPGIFPPGVNLYMYKNSC
jgi:hypothetical protein